jgi:Flp pilus assembly protein TadD
MEINARRKTYVNELACGSDVGRRRRLPGEQDSKRKNWPERPRQIHGKRSIAATNAPPRVKVRMRSTSSLEWSKASQQLKLRTLCTISAFLLVLTAALVPPASAVEVNRADSQAPAPDSQPGHELLSRAKSLAQNGNFFEADKSIRQYLEADQKSGEAHFLLGYVLFREIQAKAATEGHIDPQFQEANAKAALAEFTEGAKYARPTAFDLKTVALCYVLLGGYADADKWLTQSVAMNPNDPEAWYYLGRSRYNEQRFQQAISAFKECLSRDPKNVKTEDNLGLAYAALDRYDDAIAAYRTAIEWQLNSLIKDSGPYIDLGSLLLDQNHVAEAVEYLSQAVAISPQESRGHGALGKAYLRANDLEKAQRELEEAVELAPSNSSLHYVLGQVYRKRGFQDKANAEFARTSELNGSHSSPVNDLPNDRAGPQ